MSTVTKTLASCRRIAATKLSYQKYEQLNAIAQSKEITVSALIRSLILEYLNKENAA